MERPRFVYHGSLKRIEKLEPRKPDDPDPRHSKKGVYATSDKDFALGFAMTKSDTNHCFFSHDKMMFNLVKGKPNKTIYLHVLDAADFQHNHKSEFICDREVVPVEIIKIDTSELGHLWRRSSEEELAEYLKDRDAWVTPGD
jgi:hypothetical protein